jgi:hypothetical protein
METQATTADTTPARDASVRERPILFSGPMVRAILDGSKTQTRRVVKPQPFEDDPELVVGKYHPAVTSRDGFEEPGDEVFGVWNYDGDYAVRCPYGAPGGRLWVRETWKLTPECGLSYRADPPFGEDSYERGWKPSIHMPRRHSRVALELTEVRVERLQAITAEGAIAEGVPSRGIERDGPCIASAIMYLHDFEQLWNGINAERGYGWDANPWVWVLTFRRATDSPA